MKKNTKMLKKILIMAAVIVPACAMNDLREEVNKSRKKYIDKLVYTVDGTHYITYESYNVIATRIENKDGRIEFEARTHIDFGLGMLSSDPITAFNILEYRYKKQQDEENHKQSKL